MKTKIILFFLLAWGSLMLVACNGTGAEAVPPTAESIAPDSEAAAAAKISVDNCAEAEAGTHALIFAAQGVCFLYPDNYDAVQAEDNSNIGLYVRSLLNTEAPLLTLYFEEANGRSLDDIVDERIEAFAFPDSVAETMTLGGEPAVRLDNLPGQDTNRRVIALHNDRVYDLVIMRIGADYGAVNEQAEALYQMVTDSFQFIGIEPYAPLLAGPECPEVPADMILFTNDKDGFCLLLPGEYAVEIGEGQTVAYVDSLQDVTHARLFLTVEDANGRSLPEITDALEQEMETAIPGYDVTWSFGLMLDGVFANQFDQVPGQDLSRKVVFVQNGRVYTLTFTPDSPDAGDAYIEMQTLYNTVLDSFSFLWQQ